MQIGVLTNPLSRKNKPRLRRREELEQVVGGFGLVRQTASVQEIKPVLREFLRRGLKYWVSDGGDGTLHWMVNEGLDVLSEEEFRRPGAQLPACVPTNGGTIDFVAKKAGITGSAPAILTRLAAHAREGTQPAQMEVDTLQIELTRAGEREPLRRRGFAVAAGGIGQRFFTIYYRHQDPSAFTLAKIVGLGALSIPFNSTRLGRLPGVPPSFRSYAQALLKPTLARVTIDGEELAWCEHTGIHAGSIDINLGGVLRLFPDARAAGQLHFLVGAVTPWEMAANLPNMVRGGRMRAAEIYDGPGHAMTIEAQGDELLTPVIDGEVYQGIERLEITAGSPIRVARLERSRKLIGSRPR